MYVYMYIYMCLYISYIHIYIFVFIYIYTHKCFKCFKVNTRRSQPDIALSFRIYLFILFHLFIY